MRLEKAREREGIGGLPLDTDGERPRPARREPGIERSQVGPGPDHGCAHAPHGLALAQDHATRDIAVARDELGQAVHDHGRAVLDGAEHGG